MAGNIPGTKYSTQDFLSKFGNIAQSSQYRAHWQFPNNVRNYLRAAKIPTLLLNEGSVLCKATSLPGSSLMTHDVANDFYGVTQKSAYRRQFDGTIDLTFYVDDGYNMLYMFEGWMEYIMSMTGSSSKSTESYYTAAYPDSYRSELYVYKFNKDQDGPGAAGVSRSGRDVQYSSGPRGNITYTFINAFPQNISSTAVSYDPSSNLEFTVTFAYERYITDRTGAKNVDVTARPRTRSFSMPQLDAPRDNPSAQRRNDKEGTRWIGKNSTWTDRWGNVIAPLEGSAGDKSLNQETGEPGTKSEALRGQALDSTQRQTIQREGQGTNTSTLSGAVKSNS
jgi:hypothetical protein